MVLVFINVSDRCGDGIGFVRGGDEDGVNDRAGSEILRHGCVRVLIFMPVIVCMAASSTWLTV